MTLWGFSLSRNRGNSEDGDIKTEAARKQCDVIGAAIKSGDIGDTVTAVQQLILQYYDNVRGQADDSFQSANRVALFGFFVLLITVFYVMFMDLMPHLSSRFTESKGGIGVGTIGLIGSAVVEFIAGVQFVLYGRATRQFGAFHICLERTHRYLLAYEMTVQMKEAKDQTIEKVVCIMANAPMITREDIDGVETGRVVKATKKRVDQSSPLKSGAKAGG
jgi:hypothetical protein